MRARPSGIPTEDACDTVSCPKSGLLGLSALFAGPALAQTATTQFNVQITISAECQINSATDPDFGSSEVIDTAVEATSAITVQCTNGTPYDVGLNAVRSLRK